MKHSGIIYLHSGNLKVFPFIINLKIFGHFGIARSSSLQMIGALKELDMLNDICGEYNRPRIGEAFTRYFYVYSRITRSRSANKFSGYFFSISSNFLIIEMFLKETKSAIKQIVGGMLVYRYTKFVYSILEFLVSALLSFKQSKLFLQRSSNEIYSGVVVANEGPIHF